MEPILRVSAEDETQFRMETAKMYRDGGVQNVLDCILTMQKVQNIIIEKLSELIDEEQHD